MNYSFTEDQWGQDLMHDEATGKRCLLGHLYLSGRRGVLSGYLHLAVRALFPERVNDFAVVTGFNDHPDTTFEDVQLVWKHAVHALEEAA